MKKPVLQRFEITRREFFNYGWMGSLGILAALVAGMLVLFSLPRIRKGEFGGVIEVGPITELPSVGDPPVNFSKGKFWLVRTESGLLALNKTCTHLDCLFSWDPPGNIFICPCHGSRYKKDGSYLEGPASRWLDRFVVQIVSSEGNLVSQTDVNTGEPLPLPERVPLPTNTVGEDDTSENKQLSYFVHVDTGQKILGKNK
jgi:cytochrome b6-f complex iron-sulfur subunit